MDLKDLGLTSNESKVYDTLLRLGKSSAAMICKESKVPYGRIYTVLSSLEEKGLIKTIPEDTKRYVACDPQRFHEIIDERIKNLMEMDNKIRELKKVYEEHGQEPIVVVKGKSNFYKIEKECKEPEKYNYAIKYTFETEPNWMRKTKERMTKGVEIKHLGKFDYSTSGPITEWRTVLKEIKPIDNDGVAVSIVDDEEVMIGLIRSNTTMLIRDKAFAKVMRQLFVKYYAYTDHER